MIYDKSPSRLQKKITEPIKLQVLVSSLCLYGTQYYRNVCSPHRVAVVVPAAGPLAVE